MRRILFVIVFLAMVISCGFSKEERDYIMIEHVGVGQKAIDDLVFTTNDYTNDGFKKIIRVNRSKFQIIDHFVVEKNSGLVRVKINNEDPYIFNVVRHVANDSSNYVLKDENVSFEFLRALKHRLAEKGADSAVIREMEVWLLQLKD